MSEDRRQPGDGEGLGAVAGPVEMATVREGRRPEAAAEVTAGGESLTVMSYNIQGHGQLFSRTYLEGIAQTIGRERPDVVGLQEVHRRTWASRFEDQIEHLAELTGMEAHFGRSVSTRTGEYGNAVLTRGTVKASEVHVLPREAERRSLFHTHLEVRGQSLDFFVTHLAAWGRLTRSIRTDQARFIAEHLEGADGPFILVGDFNAPPGSPELEAILEKDWFQLVGERRMITHRLMRWRIDYILADPEWTTIESRAPKKGPSDHFPVVAHLEREGPTAAIDPADPADPDQS